MSMPMYKRIGRIETTGTRASINGTIPSHAQDQHHDAGTERVADPAAHLLPSGMTDVDRQHERTTRRGIRSG
jgi:hypothetical protein